MTTLIHESATKVAAVTTAAGLLEVEFINPGWGSSGYYSREVLEAAAPLFAPGTHLYFDHPTAEEDANRPERSVRDIAAIVVEGGTVNPETGGIRGVVQPLAMYHQLLTDEAFTSNVGLSIRGSAIDVVVGEAEGRRGPIIEGLADIKSVDFVTRAGRGGRVLQVMESARPIQEARNVGQWVESHIHRDFTNLADNMAAEGRLTRDERITMSSAIGDALAAFVTKLEADAAQLYQRDIWDDPNTGALAVESAVLSRAIARGLSEATADERRTQLSDAVRTTYGADDQYAWVRDFDETTVWFEVHADDEAMSTWQQTYTVADDDNSSTLTGQREQVRAVTNYVPVTRPGTTQESQEDTMPEIKIEESEHKRLLETEERAVAAERELAEARTALAKRDRRDRATVLIGEAAKAADVEFTALETRGLLADLPLTKEGALDEAAFTASVTESAAEATTRLGKGGVTGFGGSGQSNGGDVSESDFDAAFAPTKKGA